MRRRAVRGLPTHSRERSEITARRDVTPYASLESDTRPTFQLPIVKRDTVTPASQDQHCGSEQLMADM